MASEPSASGHGATLVSPDARIVSFRGVQPVLGASVFVAPGAILLGDVIVAEKSSIWYQTVVRGDMNFIRIGRSTNLQDHCTIHVTSDIHPVQIGDRVTVGHAAVIHGATLGNDCLIGMGSLILDGARVGAGSLIAAGSVVPPGMEIPPRSLAQGAPARIRRTLTDEELRDIHKAADRYVEYAILHARELGLIAR